jgi:hypothetical protein
MLSYFFIFKRKTGTKTSLIISFIGSAAFYILASCLSDIAIAIISGVQIELSDIKDMVIGYITYFQGGLIGLFLIILILFIAIKIYNKTYQTKIKKALVACFEILASFIEICNFGRGFDSMLSGIAIIIAIIILLKIEGSSPIFTFSRFISLAVVAFGTYFSITAYDTLFALAGIFFIIFGLYSLITDRIPGRFYQKKRKRRINYTQEEKDAAAQEAGRKGEERVSNVLNKLEGYVIFDAYTLKKEHMYIRNNNGNFNEIDHLVIGPNGIFHIETKSYSGSITILENGNWVRVKRDSDEAEELSNPCEQILIHEGVLKGVLGRKYSDYLHSLICFGNEYRDNYRINGESNCQFDIIFNQDLNNYIMSYNNKISLTNGEIYDVEKIIKDHISSEKPRI